MAKVVCEYDTNDKYLSVKMDGKELANVVGVSLGKSWSDEGEYICDVMMVNKDEENDLVTYTRICADETGELVKAGAVDFKDSNVRKDVLDYFSKDK